MEDRRYPEGNTPPKIKYTDPTTSPSYRDTLRMRHRNMWAQPVSDDILSTTNDPKECFVNRKNSRRFQQFMLGYAYALVTARSLSGEV